MGKYCLQTNEVKAIKKSLKKWGQIHVDDDKLKGVITIKNVRKYPLWWEADVELQGLSYFNYKKGRNFYTSDIQKENVSKIKVNRLLREYVFKHVSMRLKYFDADIQQTHNIKKIKWI